MKMSIAKSDLILVSVLLLFLFSPVAFAQDDVWSQYEVPSNGHYQLVEVTHNSVPVASEGTNTYTFTSSKGLVSGTGAINSPSWTGSASSSVKWSDLPSTGKENETFTINADVDSTATNWLGSAISGISVDGHSADCTTFNPNGYVPMTVPQASLEAHASSNEEKKSQALSYTFPQFYWPWSCNMSLSNVPRGQLQPQETMLQDSQQRGKYFIYITVAATTVGGIDTYTYKYEWVPGSAQAGGTLNGRITDGFGDPMPYMNVTLKFLGNIYSTSTDEAGNYEIKDVSGLTPNQVNPPTGVLTFYLEYWRDGKNYFTVWDNTFANDGAREIVLQKKFLIRYESDKTQSLDFMMAGVAPRINSLKGGDPGSEKIPWLKEGEEIASGTELFNLKHFAPTYYYISNAADFMLTILNANIDYKLPVDTYIGGNHGTMYTLDTSSIFINGSDAAYGSANRPRNREYHEFSHHLMFSQWNGENIRTGNDTNHGGFINANTGDSYTEGFAEFMASVIADYTSNPNDPNPSNVYANIANFDGHYYPWDMKGKYEELAIASSLWQIYEPTAKGGTVGIPITQLYPVLVEKHANFLEYMNALKAKFPDKAAAIDKVLLANGIFQDTYKGNGVRDRFEPYLDVNKNKKYDVGEPFVDYGIDNNRKHVTYDKSDEIGRITNYQRPTRGQAVEIPNAFLKVADERVSEYTVTVHFNTAGMKDYSYTTEMREGKIYLEPPQSDADATITVAPLSKAYTAANTYTVSSADYVQKIYSADDSQGYFDTFDFGLTATGQSEETYTTFNNVKPTWNTDAGPVEQEPTVTKLSTTLPLDQYGNAEGIGLGSISPKSLPCCGGFFFIMLSLLTFCVARGKRSP